MVLLKDLFEKDNFKKVSRSQQKHEIYSQLFIENRVFFSLFAKSKKTFK